LESVPTTKLHSRKGDGGISTTKKKDVMLRSHVVRRGKGGKNAAWRERKRPTDLPRKNTRGVEVWCDEKRKRNLLQKRRGRCSPPTDRKKELRWREYFRYLRKGRKAGPFSR